TAKGAMMLLSPPAAAGSLHRDLSHHQRMNAGGLKVTEEIAVIWVRQINQVGAFLYEEWAQVACALHLAQKLRWIRTNVSGNRMSEIRKRPDVLAIKSRRKDKLTGHLVRRGVFRNALVNLCSNNFGKTEIEVTDITLHA